MAIDRIIEESLNSIRQVSELAEVAKPPCLSIYLSAYSPENDSIRFDAQFKAALQLATQKLGSTAVLADGDDLPLEQLRQFAKERRWEKERGGLAFFCARNLIRIFRTSHVVSESVHVGNDFHITPLLSVLSKPTQFIILALSEKHVRLLRCSNFEAVEVDLPASIPRSVEQAGAFDKPDHDLEARSAAGSAPGSRSRIHFGTGTAEEKTEEYISHFFRIIDHEINQRYRGEELPLILAAVERELAIYKKLSNYPHLLEGNIQGSPERVSNSDLHHSALKVLDDEAAVDETNLLSQFAEKQSSGLTLTGIPSMLTAARSGHIQLLLLSEQNRASDQEELLNLIALETLRHGGHVATFAHQQLPSGGSAAAILRYKAFDATAQVKDR
ncbi:hypothetical protein P8936_08505 [Edaphobacter paludis]|uniref:Uncharacterized protein n=1 Tax=Edaphobacter paludis TaxID=3035702 RepID=A0AAU7DDJ2_9BACT